MHIAGRWFAEATVLRAAHAFQSATDWHRKCPAPVAHPSTIDSRMLRISPYWRSRAIRLAEEGADIIIAGWTQSMMLIIMLERSEPGRWTGGHGRRQPDYE
jgi:hypothetical protein